MAKNPLKLAKNNSTTGTSKNKSTEKNYLEKKAQEKVDEVLREIDSITEKKTESYVNNSNKISENKISENKIDGIEWLQEQIELLSNENEQLKNQIDILINKQNLPLLNNSIDDSSLLKENIIKLFNELQSHHLRLGENFIIYPIGFMKRLIKFFPFLEEYRKF